MVALIQKYRAFLSVTENTPIISLHEGNTPLIPAPRLSERIGAKVYLKFEGAKITRIFMFR